MDEPIENLYFNWLYSQVSDIAESRPSHRYFKLLNQLHGIEFVWSIIGDDNRMQDGRDLRTEFLHANFLPNDGSLASEGCSVLEMLIAFSRRASFITDESLHDWFWAMLHNLGLEEVHDASPVNTKAIDEIINTFVWRTYTSKGAGGLFPLHETQKNQRKVEIWYQFNEYLCEIDYG